MERVVTARESHGHYGRHKKSRGQIASDHRRNESAGRA